MTATAHAAPEVGKPAPDFSAVDSNGKTVKLSDFRGKTVVLEWTNDGCPYVKKHYGSGNMQSLQKDAAAKGIVWLTIVSSAPGKQGYVDGAGANGLTASRGAAPAAVLLDPDGAVGHLYDARTTPHMFIVDAGHARLYGRHRRQGDDGGSGHPGREELCPRRAGRDRGRQASGRGRHAPLRLLGEIRFLARLNVATGAGICNDPR